MVHGGHGDATCMSLVLDAVMGIRYRGFNRGSYSVIPE